MIPSIIDFSLKNRFLVVMGALLLMAAGIFSALHLPVDAVPDITNTQVQINTAVAGLAPEETEKLVTYPLELALAGIQGVEEFRSLTKSGLSQVTLVFRDGSDLFRARQLVSERLVQVELPPGMTPQMSPISTGLGEILYYTLDYKKDAPERKEPRERQLMDLRDAHDYIVKPFLRTVPGVAEVNSSGGYERQLVILPKPESLANAGMTFGELAEIIGQNVDNAGGGVIERGEDRVLIRGVSKVASSEDISNLPVKFAAGVEPLRVKDLAEVGIGSNVRTGCAVENGEEAVLGTVMMLVGENSRIISKRVEGKLAELQKKLPPGLELRIQYARSEVVDRTIDTVKHNLFEGAVLVVVVLLLLLGNWRAALIVAMAIPLSFLFALIGMTFGGVSGNLMSLGAVDFGLIIDGAVVMVENIVRVLGERQHELGRKLTAKERLQAVHEAGEQVGSPMFFGVLIITLVYLPILALTGIEGKMFHPMAITVMLALGGALVLSLTLMPALCSLLLRGNISEKDNFLMRWAKGIYAPLLGLAWKTRWGVVTGVAALLVGTVMLFMSLKQEFVPTLNEGSWTAMVYQPANTSLKTSLARCVKTQQYLINKVPEVTRTFARIGTSEVATDPMSPGEYDLYIFYKPSSEWRKENGRPVSRDRLAELIREELAAEVPEQDYDFAQPIQMRFNEMLEGSRADLAVRIFGEDYDTMEKIAGQVKGVLEGLEGTNNAEFESQGRVPVLEIRVDRAAMLKFNVEASEVNEAITTAMAGHTAGTLMEHNRRRAIVVRLPENLRNDPEIMKALPVRTQDGALVDLGRLADFVEVPQVDAIGRESGRRRVGLNVDLAGGTDSEAYVNAARERISASIQMPEGYRVEFGGQFEHLQEARERLMIVVPLALVLIFVLIHSAFKSVTQTLIIYTGIPLAITGGVAALWLRGLPFSISAAIGFIALCGVAVLNGVVLISCFNQLRNEGRSAAEAVTEGGVQRLRPVLMTALVASLGFIPMALSEGAGAEVQRPLATVVIGGIVSSTFLTLFLLPVLYRWLVGRTREVHTDVHEPAHGGETETLPLLQAAS
ncbi:MAG: CusA/CzcA family heavy metal efflux RND transporter [Prosthecobacter sp.]